MTVVHAARAAETGWLITISLTCPDIVHIYQARHLLLWLQICGCPAAIAMPPSLPPKRNAAQLGPLPTLPTGLLAHRCTTPAALTIM